MSLEIYFELSYGCNNNSELLLMMYKPYVCYHLHMYDFDGIERLGAQFFINYNISGVAALSLIVLG